MKTVNFWKSAKKSKKKTPAQSIKVKPVKRKNMNWTQAKKRYPRLKPFKDTDKDGVQNMFDCRPLNRKKQGIFHKTKKNKEAKLEKLRAYNRSWYQKHRERLIEQKRIVRESPKDIARRRFRDLTLTKEQKQKRTARRKEWIKTPEYIEAEKQKRINNLKQDFKGVDLDKKLKQLQEEFRKRTEPTAEELIEKEFKPLTKPQTVKRRVAHKGWEEIVRPAVLRREGFKCSKCGKGYTKEPIHIHHERYPTTEEPTTMGDLKTLCKSCHTAQENQERTIVEPKPEVVDNYAEDLIKDIEDEEEEK